jgi:hypothetical protein
VSCAPPWLAVAPTLAAVTENVLSRHGDWEWYRFRLKKIEKDGSAGVYMPWTGRAGQVGVFVLVHESWWRMTT